MVFQYESVVRSFCIEHTRYRFVGEPLEFHYFYKTGSDDVGAWSGKSNIRESGKDLPWLHIKNLEDAFEQIADAKKKDIRYQYGIIIDFSNHAVYYDNEEALERYLKNKFWTGDILTKRRYKKEWT